MVKDWEAEMTLRTRMYLYGEATRHLFMGLALIFLPTLFNPTVYAELFTIAPRWAWIASLLIGACHLTYSAFTHNDTQARFALIGASTLALIWGTLFLLIVGDGLPAMTAAILFIDICYMNMVICSGPLRAPIAVVIHKYKEDSEHNGS
jgi:hypothetical protein